MKASFDREDTIYSWSAKATWVPWSNHNFEFSTFATRPTAPWVPTAA